MLITFEGYTVLANRTDEKGYGCSFEISLIKIYLYVILLWVAVNSSSTGF